MDNHNRRSPTSLVSIVARRSIISGTVLMIPTLPTTVTVLRNREDVAINKDAVTVSSPMLLSLRTVEGYRL